VNHDGDDDGGDVAAVVLGAKVVAAPHHVAVVVSPRHVVVAVAAPLAVEIAVVECHLAASAGEGHPGLSVALAPERGVWRPRQVAGIPTNG